MTTWCRCAYIMMLLAFAWCSIPTSASWANAPKQSEANLFDLFGRLTKMKPHQTKQMKRLLKEAEFKVTFQADRIRLQMSYTGRKTLQPVFALLDSQQTPRDWRSELPLTTVALSSIQVPTKSAAAWVNVLYQQGLLAPAMQQRFAMMWPMLWGSVEMRAKSMGLDLTKLLRGLSGHLAIGQVWDPALRRYLKALQKNPLRTRSSVGLYWLIPFRKGANATEFLQQLHKGWKGVQKLFPKRTKNIRVTPQMIGKQAALTIQVGNLPGIMYLVAHKNQWLITDEIGLAHFTKLWEGKTPSLASARMSPELQRLFAKRHFFFVHPRYSRLAQDVLLNMPLANLALRDIPKPLLHILKNASLYPIGTIERKGNHIAFQVDLILIPTPSQTAQVPSTKESAAPPTSLPTSQPTSRPAQ